MPIWSLLMLACVAIGCLLAARLLIHYFQLESYQHPGYFRTVKRNIGKAVLPGLIMNLVWAAAIMGFAYAIPENNDWLPSVLTGVCMIGCGLLVRYLCRAKNAKKPLKYTARIKRLYAVSFVVFFGLLVLLQYLAGLAPENDFQDAAYSVFFVLFWIFPLLLPLWVALAGLIAWPIEKGISEMYFRDAQRILRERGDLIKIGITGSWGKTSVKFILGTILEEKYHTLVTPSSFNTPMGVTRVIRSSLEPGHRVFVAEMGARHVGDIKEMCRLVHPQYGVLTSVGPQHLDTFKTIERVTKTKYELMDAIPDGGVCFFADDEDICRGLYEKTEKKKYLAGTSAQKDDVWAENVTVTPQGSRFTLCTKDERIECETTLLGELNIKNIVLCASVALELGLEEEQIARGIRKLQPVEHRLQLIPNPGGITLIDDAFNSNIRGAKQAFQVLSEMPGKRIVITPGMVELGNMEYEMNREFGEAMARGCDTAILVGKKRSEAIREGLVSAGFPEENIRVVDSLDEGAAYMRTIVKAGDTVLFENDLPDNY